MQGADHEPVQLLLLELVDRDRTRATGVVTPPAPPYLLLSHGEELEERVRLASEAVARIDLYVASFGFWCWWALANLARCGRVYV